MKKLLLTALVSFCMGSLAMAQQAKTKTTTSATTAEKKIIKSKLESVKPLTEKEAIIAKEKAAAAARKAKASAAKEETIESAAKHN